MKVTFITVFLGLISFSNFGQVLHCDSLITPNSIIQLSPMQDSALFSYSNIASDSIAFSQNNYVFQSITFSDQSVIATIIGDLIGSSTGGTLSTYLYPSQTYKLNITYNSISIPDNYSLDCFYSIYDPVGGDTCQIPFTLSFATINSINSLKKESIKIYPNPFTNNIILDNLPDKCNISISDLTGKVILEEKLKGRYNQLNLSELSYGYYILEIRNLDTGKKVIHEKIVKL